MFGLRYESELDPATQLEFKSAQAQSSEWAKAGHDDDGANLDGVPVGGMIQWPIAIPPARWLVCDGQAVSRTTYARLFRVLGVTEGVGDGSTTFNVPTDAGMIIYAGV